MTNMAFKKLSFMWKNGQKLFSCPEKNISEKEKGNKIFLASAIIVVRWGIRLQFAGKIRLIQTSDPKIGQRKETWNEELQTLRIWVCQKSAIEFEADRSV